MKAMKLLILGGLMAASAATTFATPGVRYWQSRGRNGVIPNYAKATIEKTKGCDQCCQKKVDTPAVTPAAPKGKPPRKP